MSDEFDNSSENNFSAFVPLLIALIGFLIWVGIQDYELNHQRGIYEQQIQAAIPNVNQAQNYANRYVSLMKDLVETSQKNAAAAQIVKDAAQAGWIKIQPNSGTNSTASPAAPSAPAATK